MSADALFFVDRGLVTIAMVLPSGKEAVMAIRGDGEFFGTRGLVEQPRVATATALTECSLVRVTRAAVIRMLREEPDFAEMFMLLLMQLLVSDQENIVDQLTNSTEKRLARVLLHSPNSAVATAAAQFRYGSIRPCSPI